MNALKRLCPNCMNELVYHPRTKLAHCVYCDKDWKEKETLLKV